MAELADALDSGSNGRKAVQVQVLLPAPVGVFVTGLRTLFFYSSPLWTLAQNCTNPNPKPIGEGFGFVIYDATSNSKYGFNELNSLNDIYEL